MKVSRCAPLLLGLAIAFASGCAAAGESPVEETRDAGGSVTAAATRSPDSSSAGGSTTGAVEVIRFVQFGNMSGRGSESVLPYIRGVEERVDYINSSGAIGGREIALISLDTAGSIETARALWESSVRDSDTLVIFWWDVDLLPAFLSELADWDGIVFVPYAADDYVGTGGPSNLFALAPPPEEEFLFSMTALAESAEHLSGYADTGRISLAFLGWPDSHGGFALTDASRVALSELGVSLVYEGEIQPSYTWDAGPAVRAATRMEANIFYVAGNAHAPAIVIDELFRQGLQGQVTVVGPSLALDLDVYGYLSSPERYTGFLAPSTLAWWSDTSNAKIVAWATNILDDGRSSVELSRGKLIGALGVDVISEAIRLVMAREPKLIIQTNDLRVALFEIELKQTSGELGNIRFLPSRRYPNVNQMRQVDEFGVFLPWP